MDELKLSDEQKSRLVARVKTYVSDELDQDIGAFEAEFLIDFIAAELGPVIYNQGLADAQQLFREKTEELSYQIHELEKALP
ncbi:DUF2164 domain-containing protein [Parahaliea mediterranea]|uniref:DUF2164 domain-containing protein n=1 Tax=Parahaliea mediterranea TaxID=651086 RepID=UPI000E2FF225|nr:DUF2164 domain-containing protein [Parahaliea mediterranea]